MNFWRDRRHCQFQILSDLHLEVLQQYDQFDVPPKAPFLVLAGDIGRLIDYDTYHSFLTRQCEQFQRVFLVLGNHEFYGTSRSRGLRTAHDLVNESSLNGKVTLLDRSRYDCGDSDIVVLGCTLQSSIPPDKQDIVRRKIQDFKNIGEWSIDDHNIEHQQDVDWLQDQIKSIRLAKAGIKKRILVITHHAPTNYGTSSPDHANNAWNSAFSTDLIGNEQYPALSDVQCWVFGHTYYTTCMKLGNVKIISNQRGYVLNKAPYLASVAPTCMERIRQGWPRHSARDKIYSPEKIITI